MMQSTTETLGSRRWSLILKLIGALLLLVGVGCALLAPAEIYCFYLFSGDGPFAYQGFGFGSFMFGNIAAQIIGYYLIAAICIPLGVGHLKMRRWARSLTLILLWSWLVVGLPLLIVFLFVLFASKELAPPVALFFLVLACAAYPLLPGLLIRFYRSNQVRVAFETRDPGSYWTEKRPQPLLVLSALFAFYAVILHILVFFRGIFPVFGTFVLDMEGFVLVDLSIWWLVLLAWGTLRARPWAWWGAMIYFLLLTTSVIWTLTTSSWADILSLLNFPLTEVEILDGLPLQGVHLALFLGLPLLLTLLAIAISKRSFLTEAAALSPPQQEATSSPEGMYNREVLN
jgi:hypothetical protein